MKLMRRWLVGIALLVAPLAWAHYYIIKPYIDPTPIVGAPVLGAPVSSAPVLGAPTTTVQWGCVNAAGVLSGALQATQASAETVCGAAVSADGVTRFLEEQSTVTRTSAVTTTTPTTTTTRTKRFEIRGGTTLRVSDANATFLDGVSEPPIVIGSSKILYTDLASAPVNAWVTVYGKRFIGAPVSGAAVFSQSDTEIVLVWSGNPVTIDGASVPVTTRPGAVKTATPATLAATCNGAAAGDVVYLRAGAYTQRCGPTDWGAQQFNLSGAFDNVSFIGYPGETASIGTIRLDYMGEMADGGTYANLSVAGAQCVNGGSYWEADESGAVNVRVVDLDCHGNYGSANTQTGLVTPGGDNWAVLGSRFTNNAPSAINNNHGVYVNVGADNVEVAWNHFTAMKMGHVIQQHTDGTLRQYDNLRVHDNFLIMANSADTRGINISGCTPGSTAEIYNNVLLNLGQNFSGVTTWCGTNNIFHNTMRGISGPTINVAGGTVVARNNFLIGGGTSGGLTQSNNVTSGSIDNNGYFVGAVPTAPNVGINLDHDAKPRGSVVSIGAYEAAAP